MILQALYEYYHRKVADPESQTAPQGFEWKEIPFLIVIDQKGNLVNFEDTRSGEGRQKRATPFLVIKSKGRSGKNACQTSNILWDHYGYVLGHPKEEKDEAINVARNQNKTFIKLVDDLSERFPCNEQFRAVKSFLEKKEQIQEVFGSSNWQVCSKIPGCNLSFKLVGETKIVAEHEDLRFLGDDIYKESDNTEKESKEGICLITGKKGLISILHTATSLPGGKSGGKLVGFQKNSGYDSYYKEQGWNSPISKVAEDAYTTALKLLLGRDSKTKFHISNTTVVFWAEKETGFESGFSFLFDRPAKDDPDRNSQEVKALFESLHSGKLNPEGSTRFYILGLSPNAARISVRFWRTGRIKDFAESIALHFSDLEMARGNNNDHEYFTLFTLLAHIAFEYKLDNIPPNLIPAMIESILEGTPYPATLQQQCIRRIRADIGEKANINRIRASILKAYLNWKNRSN